MEIPGYQIHKEIGKGGMATVYLATQESLEREVVLKVLDIASHHHNNTIIERFLAEGRIVATLNHPNIITIYDIAIADESLFISMEYVDGGDLKSRIGTPFDPDVALDHLSKIGSGLAYAHQRGIVHRDVKPANILFRHDETLLLTDFGIAKQVGLDSELTSTGMFIGSPNYVSPEQADGLVIDGRADIYSLGCIFYEMLTGQKPYQSKTVIDIVIQHKQAPIPVFSNELKEFQPLLNLMMSKNPDDRFESSSIMNGYIENIINRRKGQSAHQFIGHAETKTTAKNWTFTVLMVLLFLSASFFGAVNYLEISIKNRENRIDDVPIATSLPENQSPVIETSNSSVTEIQEKTDNKHQATSKEVTNALLWLGKQSLEEYRLTHPPKDNAYFYFSRLLEIDPNSKIARNGLLNIADRYAILAERSFANNEYEKTEAYINLGLKISPDNKTLLSLQALNDEIREKSFLTRIKEFFTG